MTKPTSAVHGGSKLGGSRGFGISWLDVKLGLRMLVRQPALTAVAVFALAIGIPASLLPDHVYNALKAPLPFDPQERVVGVRLVNVADGGGLVRALHDFSEWREELTTIRPLAAARTDPYNVISNDGRAEPIRGAQMTASGFEALGVAPVAGRVLLASDEMPGAPDVVVMGYDVWQSRLGGDPNVV